MSRQGYPELQAHLEEHDALTEQLLQLQAQFEAGPAGTLTARAMETLRDWLLGHIEGSDRAVGEYLRARAGKPTVDHE